MNDEEKILYAEKKLNQALSTKTFLQNRLKAVKRREKFYTEQINKFQKKIGGSKENDEGRTSN